MPSTLVGYNPYTDLTNYGVTLAGAPAPCTPGQRPLYDFAGCDQPTPTRTNIRWFEWMERNVWYLTDKAGIIANADPNHDGPEADGTQFGNLFQAVYNISQAGAAAAVMAAINNAGWTT